MKISAGLQLLCLMVYASCAHGIMVKYGTKGGPIEPPAPTPALPVPQPYRVPAPVWEERSNDTPDPNAKWRPQLFVPQPRYTQIAFNMLANQPQTNAQRFVNSYIPNHQPVQVQPVENYFTPAQILSSQSLPGLGIRYFVPAYINRPQIKTEHRQEDASQNHINNNEVSDVKDSQDDLQWKYEKENGKRIARNSQETSRHTYQWPLYVRPQHQ